MVLDTDVMQKALTCQSVTCKKIIKPEARYNYTASFHYQNIIHYVQ